MTRQHRPVDVDELLSKGHLSGPQYDVIAERVLARASPRGRRRSALLLSVPLAALAAGLAAWLLLPKSALSPPDGHNALSSSEAWRAKGGPEGLAGAISVGCDGAPSAPTGQAGGVVCARGATLLFAVNSAVASGYVSAFAQREGVTDSERIAYFPTAHTHSPLVEPGEGTVALPLGIRIDERHTVGKYRLHVVLTRNPPTNDDELRRAFDSKDAVTLRFEVVP